MKVPIPSYLIALAIGHITYKPLDAEGKYGIVTEPEFMDACLEEFSDLPTYFAKANEIM